MYASFSGNQVIYQAQCSSTNTVAMQLLSQKPPTEGAVVITDHQYQGKGQRGTTWLSEPYKNLTFSLILYPNFLSSAQSFALNMMTTLAIHQVISTLLSTYIPQDLTIKWPNDLYYQDKKLGGVLIENTIHRARIKSTVIGIGLNINQTQFALPTATSLALICKQQFNLNNLLNQLLEAIQAHYNQFKNPEQAKLWKPAYLKKLYGFNHPMTFQAALQPFQGIIRDVDALGRLVIEQPAGTLQHYVCKEVSLVNTRLK